MSSGAPYALSLLTRGLLSHIARCCTQPDGSWNKVIPISD